MKEEFLKLREKKDKNGEELVFLCNFGKKLKENFESIKILYTNLENHGEEEDLAPILSRAQSSKSNWKQYFLEKGTLIFSIFIYFSHSFTIISQSKSFENILPYSFIYGLRNILLNFRFFTIVFLFMKFQRVYLHL